MPILLLFKLQVSNIAWYLLCLTVVGAIWAVPHLTVEKAVFYKDLKTDFNNIASDFEFVKVENGKIVFELKSGKYNLR